MKLLCFDSQKWQRITRRVQEFPFLELFCFRSCNLEINLFLHVYIFLLFELFVLLLDWLCCRGEAGFMNLLRVGLKNSGSWEALQRGLEDYTSIPLFWREALQSGGWTQGGAGMKPELRWRFGPKASTFSRQDFMFLHHLNSHCQVNPPTTFTLLRLELDYFFFFGWPDPTRPIPANRCLPL